MRNRLHAFWEGTQKAFAKRKALQVARPDRLILLNLQRCDRPEDRQGFAPKHSGNMIVCLAFSVPTP